MRPEPNEHQNPHQEPIEEFFSAPVPPREGDPGKLESLTVRNGKITVDGWHVTEQMHGQELANCARGAEFLDFVVTFSTEAQLAGWIETAGQGAALPLDRISKVTDFLRAASSTVARRTSSLDAVRSAEELRGLFHDSELVLDAAIRIMYSVVTRGDGMRRADPIIPIEVAGSFQHAYGILCDGAALDREVTKLHTDVAGISEIAAALEDLARPEPEDDSVTHSYIRNFRRTLKYLDSIGCPPPREKVAERVEEFLAWASAVKSVEIGDGVRVRIRTFKNFELGTNEIEIFSRPELLEAFALGLRSIEMLNRFRDEPYLITVISRSLGWPEDLQPARRSIFGFLSPDEVETQPQRLNTLKLQLEVWQTKLSDATAAVEIGASAGLSHFVDTARGILLPMKEAECLQRLIQKIREAPTSAAVRLVSWLPFVGRGISDSAGNSFLEEFAFDPAQPAKGTYRTVEELCSRSKHIRGRLAVIRSSNSLSDTHVAPRPRWLPQDLT